MLYLEFLFLLLMLYIGSRYGGIGLGVVSGIGLAIEVFVFRMPVGKAPIDVMLIILAVVTCASVLEAAGGLKFMLQIAERILRKNPKRVTLLGFISRLFINLYAWYWSLCLHNYANHRRCCIEKQNSSRTSNGSVFRSIAISHHIKPTFCSCCILSR